MDRGIVNLDSERVARLFVGSLLHGLEDTLSKTGVPKRLIPEVIDEVRDCLTRHVTMPPALEVRLPPEMGLQPDQARALEVAVRRTLGEYNAEVLRCWKGLTLEIAGLVAARKMGESGLG